MVAHHQVEQYARCHGGANERHGAVDALQENVGDGVEHVARHHARAETHGAKDEPDGIEHTCHASCGNQVVDGGKACIHLRLGVTSNHDSLEKTLGRGGRLTCNLHQDFWLQYQGTDTCREGREQEGNQRWCLAIDEITREYGDKECPKGDMKSVFQAREILSNFHLLAVIREPDEEIEQDGEGDARHRGIEHVTDMRKEVGAGDGRGKHRGITHRGELVAKVGS